MAGLFLVQARDPDFARSALAGARAQFARHGFADPVELRFPGWHLLHAPHIIGGPDNLLVEGEDLVAVAGTLTCDGKLGRPALAALLAMAGAPDWSRLGGQFVALVVRNGEARLFTDFFGAFQIYHDADARFFSTSLLSAAAALPKVSFATQAVYEFAFNVVPLGDDTVFAELKRLGPDRIVQLGVDGARSEAVAKPLAASVLTPAERLDAHRGRLSAIVRSHAEAFGNNIFCPLSGGMDSRLVLAAFRAEGIRPQLYVYGPEDGADVRVARQIGGALGLEVEWFDKQGFREVAPDDFPKLVEQTFHGHDGLPNFGGLFDNGGNAAARDARHAHGALAASGGSGEIFRNFFYLPDRPTPASAVTRAFFARYAREDATELFDEAAFLRAIDDKILHALGRDGDRNPLPRHVVEEIYPRVRCRALFGKEISDESRYGAYFMPFLDHQLVALAAPIPIRLKNAGRYEARLITAINPELARQPSAYGHHFAGPPSLAHRWSEWSTRRRPIRLRQGSYAIQRRVGRVEDEHGGLLGPDHLGRVINLDYPAMRRFFRIDRIGGDLGLLRRVACLEYFAGWLGSRLAD